METRGYTLTEMLVALAAFLLISALTIPAAVQAVRRSKAAACQGNLATLWKLQVIHRYQYGCRRGMIRETGKDFWRALSRTNPPLIDGQTEEIYRCPFVEASADGLDYWGPAQDVNRLRDPDLVGSDAPDNHGPGARGGGTVLRKSGDVVELNFAEFLGAAARCRP